MPPLRIWRSPYSDFNRDETRHAAEVYTAQHLRGIAEAGFNAIWIRGVLRDLTRTNVFPEFGKDSAPHLRSLRTVIRRCERQGLRCYLYMQPGLGLPERSPFWRRHPEAKGAVYDKFGQPLAALCVSAPEVRAFLREAACDLSDKLPELAGLIVITASEHIQHCYSHYGNPDIPELAKAAGSPVGCPRCDERRPRDVVADIIRNVRRGLKQANNGADLIAWNWSWSFYEPDPQTGVINMLPRDVKLMAGFERGDTRIILGKRRPIDEYSLSFAGPSGRFVKTLRAARRRGLNVMTKLQIGVTHELATVPNLPLIGKLYDKARAMRRLRVRDFMGCWNFGNMLTANTAAFLRFMDAKRLPPRARALKGFAASYFPGCDAQQVVKAWQTFERAMDSYPFCIAFLYFGPLNYAVAHPIEPGPLDGKPCARSWMFDKRGDELRQSLGPYSVPEIVRGLGSLQQTWWLGVEHLERGLASCTAAAAQEETDSARMAGHCFQSGWNLYRAYRLRSKWSPSRLAPLQQIMRDEREHLADALAIARSDRRMGFHSECQRYMFTASGIRRKIKRLDQVLRTG